MEKKRKGKGRRGRKMGGGEIGVRRRNEVKRKKTPKKY